MKLKKLTDMMKNIENVNGEFGQTDSNVNGILNTPEDLNEGKRSGEDLSCFLEEYDWAHGFSKGDVVWYHLNSSYVIKRSKIVEMKATEGAITKDRLFMENGDEVNIYNAYHSKKDILESLIREVKSNISHSKIILASTQHHIDELERRLSVLEKHASKAKEKDMPEQENWTVHRNK